MYVAVRRECSCDRFDFRATRDCPRVGDHREVPPNDRNVLDEHTIGLVSDATILGEQQWTWLGKQLRQPAEIRIIASSIQVVAEDHRFEKWMNHPRERARLYKLIGQAKANGVIFISGDRHLAELSRMDGGVGYPLYDLTSSALNNPSGWYNEINRHRWSRAYREPNFGLITIDWDQADPRVTLEIRKVDGKPAIRHSLALSGLGGE